MRGFSGQKKASTRPPWRIVAVMFLSMYMLVMGAKDDKAFDFSKLNLDQSESLMRELARRVEVLRAASLGFLLPHQVDNTPMPRGIERFDQLPMEHIHQCISAMGQIRLSRVRTQVRHIIQWRWLLEKCGMQGSWQVPRNDRHRSVRTGATWLRNEVEPSMVQLAFQVMPSAEMLMSMAGQEQAQQLQAMSSALTSTGGLLGHHSHALLPAFCFCVSLAIGGPAQNQQPSAPFGLPSNLPSNLPTPGGASSHQPSPLLPPVDFPQPKPAAAAAAFEGYHSAPADAPLVFGNPFPNGEDRPDPNASAAGSAAGDDSGDVIVLSDAEFPDLQVVESDNTAKAKAKAKSKSKAKARAKSPAASPKCPPMKKKRM
eukprot:g2356.t1